MKVFTLLCNKTKVEIENIYVSYAHSLVCDPWGRVQAQAEAAPELLICDIDLAETDAVRAQIPILRARRTDLYQLKYEKDS